MTTCTTNGNAGLSGQLQVAQGTGSQELLMSEMQPDIGCWLVLCHRSFTVFLFWVTGELSNHGQMVKVPNEA